MGKTVIKQKQSFATLRHEYEEMFIRNVLDCFTYHISEPKWMGSNDKTSGAVSEKEVQPDKDKNNYIII